jgi:hypothetical protein
MNAKLLILRKLIRNRLPAVAFGRPGPTSNAFSSGGSAVLWQAAAVPCSPAAVTADCPPRACRGAEFGSDRSGFAAPSGRNAQRI